MRLKESDLTTVYLKEPMNSQDDEGYSISGWGDPQPIRMNVQSAGGTVNAQIYGLNILRHVSIKAIYFQKGTAKALVFA